ncbi:cysteine hydrolase family protein [Notoacmeibacter ruber]|uniref:Cysteine hydrolase n=1 Tax=Notoacmeibacter ruber TaxID=2670375 RepID=A0A3L7J9K5_9HYPH|nr:cysteine hydrolase family protein [Notoacmeibacter ruber]RLQ87428.1 cysteine hydrolase [Notoacmeibacter ruber]
MNDTPKTLLQHVNAVWPPAKLDAAVLISIDVQNEYVTGKLPLAGVEQAIERVAALLESARKAGTPIIHIQHRGGAGGLFDPATDSFDIHEKAAPAEGEAVVEKSLPNSFAGTELAERLEATGRKELILCGFMTHMCVSATARSALDHGYRSTIVSDACATRDLPSPHGGIVAAKMLHEAELAALSDRFAAIAPTADFC